MRLDIEADKEYKRNWHQENKERNNQLSKERRREKQDKLSAMKLALGCTDCGYNSNSAALDFDHVRGTKRFGIALATRGHSWATIEQEIAKCEVVCANCHRVRTERRRHVAC